jgi:hypothetical protein
VAGYFGHALITALLLARGADYDIPNNLGLTSQQEMKGETKTKLTSFTPKKFGVFFQLSGS